MKQENLIFLISQPRAGSTLLQSMLNMYPSVCTASETWLMHQNLLALLQDEDAPFIEKMPMINRTTYSAQKDFLSRIPNGRDVYIRSIRQHSLHMYEHAMKESCTYFLDKTPRNCLFANQLVEVFPDANYIFLIRNPLAVLCSSWRNWGKRTKWYFSNWAPILYRGPHSLLQSIQTLDKKAITVHYEQLVTNPEPEMKRICNTLNITYDRQCLEYSPNTWKHGDKQEIHKHSSPNPALQERWKSDLDDPQCLRLATEYLQYLGKDTFEKLGYSFEEYKSLLEEKTKKADFNSTYSLEYVCLDSTFQRCQLENEKIENKQTIDALHQEVDTLTQRTKVLREQVQQFSKSISSIESSMSYKIGKTITFFPRLLLRKISKQQIPFFDKLKKRHVDILQTIVGFIQYHLLPKKKLVLIASPMRSGSTLLKALLGSAPDVSHLTEINVKKLSGTNKYQTYYNLFYLAKEEIIVIKKPVQIQSNMAKEAVITIREEQKFFPKNFIDTRIILLARRPDGLVPSFIKMTATDTKFWSKKWSIPDALDYWCKAYTELFNFIDPDQANVKIVQYEHLVEQPISVTKDLFTFIGSKQTNGIDEYSCPTFDSWRWGKDDNGEKIWTLKVAKSSKNSQLSDELHTLIVNNIVVTNLLEKLGYTKSEVCDNTQKP